MISSSPSTFTALATSRIWSGRAPSMSASSFWMPFVSADRLAAFQLRSSALFLTRNASESAGSFSNRLR